MKSFREIKNLQYGIFLNSCKCQVFNTSRSPKTYEVIKKGSLVKFQYRKCKSGSVRTLIMNKSEVYMQDSLHYISIDFKLYKYLNAINDFEERVKFYTNYERRQFVLHLTRNSDVSVGFSSGQQTKAVFQEIYENEENIFINVELMERPFKYSLPANMINTIDSSDNRSWLEKLFCVPTQWKFDYSTLEYWRCYDNAQKRITCNVSRRASVPPGSCLQNNYHEPRKNLILDGSYKKVAKDERRTDFTHNTVGRNSKRDENPSSLPINILINSEVCDVCLNVCEDNICRTCCDNQMKIMFGQNNSQINVDPDISSDTRLFRETQINSPEINTYQEADLSDKNLKLCRECLSVNENNICLSCDTEKISGQNNSQTKIDSRISLDTNLSSETLIIPLEINTHVTNEDHLPDNSKIAVSHNISASNCIICKKYLKGSDGFFLFLCKHTFCETCIKNQISLKMLAHTNIMPCCNRPIELNEIKYFLYKDEYEQFKALFKQQCFDRNCSGYHLWEKCHEGRSITFKCNKCELDNCLKCRTIHVNLTCEQYDKITNSVDKETVGVFLTWIREGIAMPCPKCEVLIEKDEGCDWVQCPFCNIEICWATRGPRWGSRGKGDTSGGCGCDFKVKKCVENCNYCH